jgi:hypothetical protein
MNKTYGKAEIQLQTFLKSAVNGLSRELHAPASLSKGKELWYPQDKDLFSYLRMTDQVPYPGSLLYTF